MPIFTKINGVATSNIANFGGVQKGSLLNVVGITNPDAPGEEGEGAGLEENPNGIRVGNTSLSSGVLNLDGNGDYLRIANANNLDRGLGDFSIRFWFNAASFPSGGNDNILNKIAPWKGWAVTLSTSTNIGGTNLSAGGITFYTNHQTSGAGSHRGVVPSGGISLNTWHHVAVTINSSNNQFKIYFDGSNELTYTATLPGATTAELWMGSARINGNSSPGLYFHGQLDQVFITQALLSNSEITAIHNNGR